MAFPLGGRLGAYEIVEMIGAGGMGEVYRATDTKLGRSVAVKVLPEAFAADPERIVRFEREARLLASLNHPHIAALYGMEQDGGRHFLIMELVEGETLAERLRRAALPVEEALTIAHQIAEALDAAHERGVIHRDLKPANVKITPDENVKVLDFGLAKAMTEESPVAAGQTGINATHSPTFSLMATQAGVILGTAVYMSPEQAKGLPADHRSDLFSFGCVLYEMLTGRQPFRGDTVADVIASVLVREPDLSAVPPNLNPRLSDLLKRCLEKNPKRRWQAVGDLRAEVEVIAADPHAVTAARSGLVPKPLWKRAGPALASAVVAAAITGLLAWTTRPSASPIAVTRFPVTLPEGQFLSGLTRNGITISPDGTQIAYVGNSRLYVRRMSQVGAMLIAGTGEGNILSPVFSPDSQSLAFYSVTDRAIKKIRVGGGTAVTIAPLTAAFGMSWSPGGITFVSENPKGVFRVSENGGKPELLAEVKDGEAAYGPQILPDGQNVLFTVAQGETSEHWDKASIVVASLKSRERKLVLEGGSDGRLLPTGHLVYARDGVLFGSRFDMRRLTVVGGATSILDGVRRSAAGRYRGRIFQRCG